MSRWPPGMRPGAEAVPCLLVDDLDRAAGFYREVLGFRQAETIGQPPVAVMARLPEGALLLQLAADPARSYTRRQAAPQSWDAVLYTRGIDRIATDLRNRGADVQFGIGITHVSDRTLEVRDDWGNVLAFAESAGGMARRVSGGLRRAIPARARSSLRDLRMRRLVQPHLEAFQDFYLQLADKQDIFYMFFTEGLLHWVVNAERHIPSEVNLVLLGSALPAAEERFVAQRLSHRPFHNVGLAVDPNTIWEFLFAVNRRNFGYIDIDCFVLAPGLFGELARVPDDVAVNALWTYETAAGLPIACTHLVFINASAIEDQRRRGRAVSPANYDWDGSPIRFMNDRTYCRVLTARQRQMLLKVLPADERGLPVPPGEAPFFDTLVAYQVVAYGSGYRTGRVRALRHRTQTTLSQDPDRRDWQQDMSDEVVHVGGASYYWKFFHLPEFRQLYLAAEQTMLGGCADMLPPAYAARAALLARELAHLGMTAADAADLVQHHLAEDRHLAPETVCCLLGIPTAQPDRR